MPKVIIDRKNAGIEEAAFSCPVNCFRKSEDGEFVINPEECIDCGVCQTIVEEGVILEDSEANEADIEFNKIHAAEWNQVQ